MNVEQLSTVGFPVSPTIHSRLARFVELLLDENTRLNLTAIRTPEAAWPLHICDSLALLPLLREKNASRVLDLGTGGGVPGVPLACATPDICFILIDSTRKKIDAVRRIVAALDLPNVECIWGRAETLACEARWRAAADVVFARAVAKLPDLLGYAAGFLRPGGFGVFMKSTDAVEAEVASAAPAARRQGLRWTETRRYSLPAPHGQRALAVYQKIPASGNS